MPVQVGAARLPQLMPVLARPRLGLQVALLFRLPGLWSLDTRVAQCVQAEPGFPQDCRSQVVLWN